MPDARHTFRIFISSPGDVVEERDKARSVIEGLQRQYTGVTLQPVLWEELALPATASFQESIDFLLKAKPIDVAVFVLWSRLGSPLGPAITRPDGTPYRSGTEREFDLMLAAFDRSGRKRPVILAYTRDDYAGFQHRLAEALSSDLEQLIAQRKLAEQFIREQFTDAEGHNLRANYTYQEPIGFAQRLRVHLRQALDDLLGADRGTWDKEPYRGLEAFHEEHARIFYGRDEETCDLLSRLRDQDRAGSAFVVVVGASGSGKSSLARAGVAANLLRYADDGQTKQWRAMFFVPALGADNLLLRLTGELAKAVPELGDSQAVLADLAAGLKPDSPPEVRLSVIRAIASTVNRALIRAAEKASGPVRLLLVLDQMEELWTDRRITPEDREQFLDCIEALARGGHVSVLATLRSDFYSHAQQMPAFMRMKGDRGHYDLLPPDAAALRRIIADPALLAGLSFERNEQTGRTLDELVLQDAARDPGALPLLQYALSELYRQRDQKRRLLTFAAYQDMGGVEGALGKRADEIFKGLPPESQAALPEILPLLVTIDVAGEQAAVRRRARLAELTVAPARRALAESLIAARFLTTDLQDGLSVVGLAHEALLRRWPQVADWIAANREHLRLRARVEQTQQRWEHQGRDDSLLLPPGLPLEEARQLQANAPHLLGSATAEYIRASIALDEQHMMQTRRRRRTVVSVLSILVVMATVAAIYASAKQREADQQRLEAVHAKNDAVQARNEAVTSQQAATSAATQAKAAEQRARIEASGSDFATAQARLGEGKWQEAVAYLGRSLRYDAKNVGSVNALWLALAYGARDAGKIPIHELAHAGTVRAASFSPDGMHVVTASEDNTARIWDANTGQQIGHPLEHKSSVVSASFSPDGTRIATASQDHTARIWNAKTGQQIGPLLEHNGAVNCAIFSPDGTRIVTASQDHSARIWNAKTGQQIGPLLEHNGAVNCAIFSPDGTRIVTASEDNTARIWNAKTGEPLGAPLAHKGPVYCAVFSPDGSRLVTASDDSTARIWNANTGEGLGLPLTHGGPVYCAMFSPDGTRVVTASWDDSAQIWNADTHQPIGPHLRHNGLVWNANFSPDGTRVVTASVDGTARIWDAETGEPLGPPLEHKDSVRFASFSPVGTRVITASDDHTARIWDAQTGQPIGLTLEHLSTLRTASFNSDGARVVTASEDHTARIWDTKTGQPIGLPLEHRDLVVSASFSPDGTRVVTASDDQTARIWDARTCQPIGTPLKHENWVNGASFSPDGTRVVTASDDHTARIWNAQTGQPIGSPLEHKDPVVSASFNSEGTCIVTASGNPFGRTGAATVWDAKTCRPIGRPLEEGRPVIAASFSGDGTRIVTASWDPTREVGAARIWDAKTDKQVGPPMQHKDYVVSAVFSQDGTRIVTASWDATARIWDAKTCQPVGPALQHTVKVNYARFSPDGTRVVTACADGSARIWDAKTCQLLGPLLKHKRSVRFAGFSSDGTRLVTASWDYTARIWQMSDREAMENLPVEQLTAFCGGAELDPQIGTLRQLSLSQRQAIRQKLEPALAAAPQWLAVARTFLRQSADSPAGPGSTMNIREAASRLIRTGDVGCAHEALAIDPGNPLIQIALSGLTGYRDQAEFLREYGVKHLPADAAVCREAARMLAQYAGVSLQSGNVPAARDAYQQSFKIFQQLAAADPHNAEAQRSLSIAYEELGDVGLQLGDAAAARDAYQRSMQIFQLLAAADLTSDAAERDLSISYDKLGKVGLQLGDAAAARDYCEKNLKISQQLAAADPTSVKAQTDLAYSLLRLGLAEESANDFTTAAKSFQQALAILAKLDQDGKIAGQPVYQGWLKAGRWQLQLCTAAPRAIDDLDFALKQLNGMAPELLAIRGRALARRGQTVDANVTAEKLVALNPKDGDNLFWAGGVYALCSAADPPKPSAGNSPETQSRESYAARAVGLLKQAEAVGYFKKADNRIALEYDHNLDALRGRDDFKNLLNEIMGQPPPKS